MDSKDLVRIGLIVLAGIVLLYLVNTYSKNQTQMEEGFYDTMTGGTEGDVEGDEEDEEESPGAGANNDANLDGFYGGDAPQEVLPSDSGDSKYSSVTSNNLDSGNQYPKDCFPKDQLGLPLLPLV